MKVKVVNNVRGISLQKEGLCIKKINNEVKINKNKYKSRLIDQHLESCLQASITNYEANMKKIIEETVCQISLF